MAEQCGAVWRSSGGAGTATHGGGRRKTTADRWARRGSDTGRERGRAGWAARPSAGPSGIGRKGREREWEWDGWAGFRPMPSEVLLFSFF